jgi:hypothetical protein
VRRSDSRWRTVGPFAVAGLGLLAAVLLHHHHFTRPITYSVNRTERTFALPTLPIQKDPAALFLAISSLGLAAGLVLGRLRRVALAGLLLASGLAASLYLHQRHEPRFFCPPFTLACPGTPIPPPWWGDPLPLLFAAGGLIVAVLFLLFPDPRQPQPARAS